METDELIKELRRYGLSNGTSLGRHMGIMDIAADRLDLLNRLTQPENNSICEENENFIQNKFGYCFYSLDSCPFIYNLYVHPQYRRCGNSRVLLKLVINEIRKSKYEGEIRIQAKPREDSIGQVDLIKYYQSMGLAIYDTRKPEEEK